MGCKYTMDLTKEEALTGNCSLKEQAGNCVVYNDEIVAFVRSTSYSFDLGLRLRGKKLLTKLEADHE